MHILNIQLFAFDTSFYDEMININKQQAAQVQGQINNLGTEKQQELDKYNTNYNNQLNQWGELQQQQQANIDSYTEEQKKLQQAQTDYNIGIVNQNKQESEKKTAAETGDAYMDYLKSINQYGGASEALATSGLLNQAYSESSKVAMNITYQNRVSTAKAALMKADTDYNNQIQQALLSNDVAMAELAEQQRQQSYDLALKGFEFTTNLNNQKLEYETNLNNTYYQRQNDLQSRIDSYNQDIASIGIDKSNAIEQHNQFLAEQARQQAEFAESIRQFNAKLAEDRRQFDATYNAENNNFSDNTAKTSDKLLKSKLSPTLSSRLADNWYYNNIDKVASKNGGISQSELEKIVQTAYKAGTIKKTDVTHILKTWGLS